MKLGNLGCGGNRPQGEHWVNVDMLWWMLKPGTPERINLDKEKNYVEADIRKPLPFPNDHFDGLLASHVCEHLTCHEAAAFLSDCRRILKPGGLLIVSVPDAEYFLKVHDRDTPENAVELFGEPISPDEPWQKSFFDYALFHREHQQLLTKASLKCLLLKAGFTQDHIHDPIGFGRDEWIEIEKIMNRHRFSVVQVAVKPFAA